MGAARGLGGESRGVVSWRQLGQVTRCCYVGTDTEKPAPDLVESLEIFPGAVSLES